MHRVLTLSSAARACDGTRREQLGKGGVGWASVGWVWVGVAVQHGDCRAPCLCADRLLSLSNGPFRNGTRVSTLECSLHVPHASTMRRVRQLTA